MATRISREAACCIPTAQASADGRCTFVKPSRPASTPRDFEGIETGDHEAVVRGVLAGQADAGFVRSDLLESMAAAGKLSLSAVRVVAPRGTPGYPICTAPGSTPNGRLPASPACRRARPAGCGGAAVDARGRAGRAERGLLSWTSPRNYQSIHELFRTAYLGPYSRERIGWRQVVTQYDLQISIFIAAVIAMLAAAPVPDSPLEPGFLRTERDRHRDTAEQLGARGTLSLAVRGERAGHHLPGTEWQDRCRKQGRRADSRDSRRLRCKGWTRSTPEWHAVHPDGRPMAPGRAPLDAGAGRAPGALRCAWASTPPRRTAPTGSM